MRISCDAIYPRATLSAVALPPTPPSTGTGAGGPHQDRHEREHCTGLARIALGLRRPLTGATVADGLAQMADIPVIIPLSIASASRQ
jgi:hypothetical protein